MRTTLLITKEKIISVAQKLFTETSFYRTTMKDIARAAKVSRRTLYTHFNSKEDIFNHIVDQKIELIEQKLEQAVRTQEIELLYSILRDGADAGIFSIKQPRRLANSLQSVFKSLEFGFIRQYEHQPRPQVINEYINILFHGIIKK